MPSKSNDPKDVLKNIGVKIEKDRQDFFSIRASWRNGDNKTAVSVHKKSGKWRDFVTGESGFFDELLEKVLGRELTAKERRRYDEIESELSLNSFDDWKPTESIYDESILLTFLPEDKFYLDKGISKKTLRFFRGGVSHSGELYKRYCFPCFNHMGVIVGFSGRDITGKSDVKWKHIGRSSNFIFGLHNLDENGCKPVLKEIQGKGYVNLVESIGDVLNLFENGVKNNLPTFGLNLSNKLMDILSGLNIKVKIALNNESSKRGNDAAVKIFAKISEHLPLEDILIHLTEKDRDFGDMNREEILAWDKKHLDDNLNSVYLMFKDKKNRSKNKKNNVSFTDRENSCLIKIQKHLKNAEN